VNVEANAQNVTSNCSNKTGTYLPTQGSSITASTSGSQIVIPSLITFFGLLFAFVVGAPF